ncbi:hypothetical protein DERF_005084 [Dermatophagoides farinae]|uniref:Uncharacterized protein n=1 Tax=Dermatophagoides farinae TaxID=6954 RepID=A0A922L6T4_DERFA|nr:hypothetical protein DERF_005084 [Dermatophagoides farinae]
MLVSKCHHDDPYGPYVKFEKNEGLVMLRQRTLDPNCPMKVLLLMLLSQSNLWMFNVDNDENQLLESNTINHKPITQNGLRKNRSRPIHP